MQKYGALEKLASGYIASSKQVSKPNRREPKRTELNPKHNSTAEQTKPDQDRSIPNATTQQQPNNNDNNKLNEAASGRLESDLGKNKDFGRCDNDNSEIKTYKIPRKLH